MLGPQDHERAERDAEIHPSQGQGPSARHPLAGRALRSNVPRGWQAETKAKANVAFDFFVETYGVKWDKAVAKLVKDRNALLTLYDYPAEHWKHIRTSNPIESTFATVRHRTKRETRESW